MDDYTLGESGRTEADDRLDQMLTAAHIELLHTLAVQQRTLSAPETDACAHHGETPDRDPDRWLLQEHEGCFEMSVSYGPNSITIISPVGGPLGLVLEILDELKSRLGKLVIESEDDQLRAFANEGFTAIREAATALTERNMVRGEFENIVTRMQHRVSAWLVHTPRRTQDEVALLLDLQLYLTAARRAVVRLFDTSGDPAICPRP